MAPVRSVFVAAACAVATAFTPLGTARVPLASPMHMSAPATGTGPSLQFQEGTDPSFKGGRLGDKLKEADTQRRKDREAAEAREATGALVGRTRGYNGEGNAAPRRRSSIDAGLARPNQLGESLSQLVQAADDAEGVPY